jgi:hypothetical protein
MRTVITIVVLLLLVLVCGTPAAGQSVSLAQVDPQRAVLQRGRELSLLDLSTAAVTPLGMGDRYAVDPQTRSILIGDNDKDRRQCAVRLVDLRGPAPVLVARHEFGGTARQIVPANVPSRPFCMELTDDFVSKFVLVYASAPDDGGPLELRAEPLPGISGIADFAMDMRFADDHPDQYAAIIVSNPSGTARRLFPELASKDPPAQASPQVFVVFDQGRIAEAFPESSAPGTRAEAEQARRSIFHIYAFRNGQVLVRSQASGSECAYWLVDARSGQLKPLDWTTKTQGLVLAINQKMDAGVFLDSHLAEDHVNEAGSVLFAGKDGPVQVIADLPKQKFIFADAIFRGDDVFITDGQRLWKRDQAGEISVMAIPK